MDKWKQANRQWKKDLDFVFCIQYRSVRQQQSSPLFTLQCFRLQATLSCVLIPDWCYHILTSWKQTKWVVQMGNLTEILSAMLGTHCHWKQYIESAHRCMELRRGGIFLKINKPNLCLQCHILSLVCWMLFLFTISVTWLQLGSPAVDLKAPGGFLRLRANSKWTAYIFSKQDPQNRPHFQEKKKLSVANVLQLGESTRCLKHNVISIWAYFLLVMPFKEPATTYLNFIQTNHIILTFQASPNYPHFKSLIRKNQSQRLGMEPKERSCKDIALCSRVKPMCVWLKGSFLAGDSRHDGPLLSERHTDVWLQPSCVPPLSETTPTLENANSVHTRDGTLVFGVQFWSVLFMHESSTFEQWNRKQKQSETSRVDGGAHVDGDGVCVCPALQCMCGGWMIMC